MNSVITAVGIGPKNARRYAEILEELKGMVHDSIDPVKFPFILETEICIQVVHGNLAMPVIVWPADNSSESLIAGARAIGRTVGVA